MTEAKTPAKSSTPELTKMPRAVAELHHSNGKVIAPGSIITDDIAKEAGLDDDQIEQLERTGAVTMVEVYKA
ncbi:hypothetical protein [Sphingomonas dokdonensis]|uniref:Uncharacterized protein n=1 Tax=Sphingomonas dokdonensis TaxID=344880 RepID=A0A245ZHI7_9SPHN|nr:hypothetical protein [Sphingomonas dokdonensis]OWK29204.1 hypothetical protein SPDO_21850 [Sphingomonas dokdonensis]